MFTDADELCWYHNGVNHPIDNWRDLVRVGNWVEDGWLVKGFDGAITIDTATWHMKVFDELYPAPQSIEAAKQIACAKAVERLKRHFGLTKPRDKKYKVLMVEPKSLAIEPPKTLTIPRLPWWKQRLKEWLKL